jgi:hypothetical protein
MAVPFARREAVLRETPGSPPFPVSGCSDDRNSSTFPPRYCRFGPCFSRFVAFGWPPPGGNFIVSSMQSEHQRLPPQEKHMNTRPSIHSNIRKDNVLMTALLATGLIAATVVPALLGGARVESVTPVVVQSAGGATPAAMRIHVNLPAIIVRAPRVAKIV